MKILKNNQDSDTALIYAGLGQISGPERKRLKDIARTLALVQNNPGRPIPDSIAQQLVRELGRLGKW